VKPNPQIRLLVWQCKFLLRSASLLVPKAQRAAWYQEWYGEIWHWLHFLAESGRLNSHTTMELTRHCWGAFPDAAFHRFDHKKVTRVLDEEPRSARFCLSAILIAVLGLILVTGFAPTIRAGFKPLPLPELTASSCCVQMFGARAARRATPSAPGAHPRQCGPARVPRGTRCRSCTTRDHFARASR